MFIAIWSCSYPTWLANQWTSCHLGCTLIVLFGKAQIEWYQLLPVDRRMSRLHWWRESSARGMNEGMKYGLWPNIPSFLWKQERGHGFRERCCAGCFLGGWMERKKSIYVKLGVRINYGIGFIFGHLFGRRSLQSLEIILDIKMKFSPFQIHSS